MFEVYQIQAEASIGIRIEHEVLVVEVRIGEYQLSLEVDTWGVGFFPENARDDLLGM